MKNILIVGAGLAGLSAGIYAQERGFNCTILEQHKIPGGNSTSWKRNGYLFECGLHWLTGLVHGVWDSRDVGVAGVCVCVSAIPTNMNRKTNSIAASSTSTAKH